MNEGIMALRVDMISRHGYVCMAQHTVSSHLYAMVSRGGQFRKYFNRPQSLVMQMCPRCGVHCGRTWRLLDATRYIHNLTGFEVSTGYSPPFRVCSTTMRSGVDAHRRSRPLENGPYPQGGGGRNIRPMLERVRNGGGAIPFSRSAERIGPIPAEMVPPLLRSLQELHKSSLVRISRPKRYG